MATTDDTDDVHLCRQHQRRGVVDVVFVSLQHRDDDVVNASSSGCGNNVETKSSLSHRGSRQRHRQDDGVVPRRHVVDNAIDATMETFTTLLSRRRCRRDVVVTTSSSSSRRRLRHYLAMVITTMQRRRGIVDVVVTTST